MRGASSLWLRLIVVSSSVRGVHWLPWLVCVVMLLRVLSSIIIAIVFVHLVCSYFVVDRSSVTCPIAAVARFWVVDLSWEAQIWREALRVHLGVWMIRIGISLVPCVQWCPCVVSVLLQVLLAMLVLASLPVFAVAGGMHVNVHSRGIAEFIIKFKSHLVLLLLWSTISRLLLLSLLLIILRRWILVGEALTTLASLWSLSSLNSLTLHDWVRLMLLVLLRLVMMCILCIVIWAWRWEPILHQFLILGSYLLLVRILPLVLLILLAFIGAVWSEILREVLHRLVVLVLSIIGHLLEFVDQMFRSGVFEASASVGLLDLRMSLVLEASAVEVAALRWGYSMGILRIVAENDVIFADDSWALVALWLVTRDLDLVKAIWAIGGILSIPRLIFIQHFLYLLNILLIELFIIWLTLQCATECSTRTIWYGAVLLFYGSLRLWVPLGVTVELARVQCLILHQLVLQVDGADLLAELIHGICAEALSWSR